MGKSGKAGPSGACFIVPAVMLVAAAILAGYGVASFLHFAGSDFPSY
jgi:hypothetical protein